MDTRRRSPVLIIAAVVALLLAYVGTYYWLVIPMPSKRVGNGNLPVYARSSVRSLADWELQYKIKPFFAPIHAIDRRIRPGVWNP